MDSSKLELESMLHSEIRRYKRARRYYHWGTCAACLVVLLNAYTSYYVRKQYVRLEKETNAQQGIVDSAARELKARDSATVVLNEELRQQIRTYDSLYIRH